MSATNLAYGATPRLRMSGIKLAYLPNSHAVRSWCTVLGHSYARSGTDTAYDTTRLTSAGSLACPIATPAMPRALTLCYSLPRGCPSGSCSPRSRRWSTQSRARTLTRTRSLSSALEALGSRLQGPQGLGSRVQGLEGLRATGFGLLRARVQGTLTRPPIPFSVV
eukprot:400729-Rhodomonas_salina.2